MATATSIRDCIIVPGFSNLQSLTAHLVARLTANGLFTQVFPAASYAGEGTVVLEPSNAVDQVRGSGNEIPTWRIALSVDAEKQTLTVNVATPIQIQDNGEIAKAVSWTNEPKNPGQINNFVDRRHISEPAASATYPMTYALTISDHGVFFAVWDQAFDERQDEVNYVSPALRWLLVQRPVDNKTGVPVTNGKAPVYCVYTILGQGTIPTLTDVLLGSDSSDSDALELAQGWTAPNGTLANSRLLKFKPINDITEADAYYKKRDRGFVINPITWTGDPESAYFWPVRHQIAKSVQIHQKFVVCESDIHRPSLSTPADQATEDTGAIINANRQVATSEDNKYVITLPKGLNTNRYAYTHELDMISYTSADVIGEGTVVDLPLYEGEYRFQALAANRQRNTGMRILFRTNTDDDVAPLPANGPMDTMPAGTIGV